MPRQRRSSPSRMSPMRAAPRPAAPPQRAMTTAPQQTAPAVAHQPTAVGQPVQQPSLFGQMAATAGGVAVGSAIGHTVGHAITGAFSGSGSESAVAEAPQQQQPMQGQTYSGYGQQELNPCQMELKQFLDCTQQQSDISLCDGFNQVLKECRMRYNVRI
ncbi:coiled-coil-helix-coiled-coil-helix domain-containing protein 2-like protein [Dinothrombium tinctorium]|uniref:Coiled-coil-helix-coiled-coil-helix domain-containing protein 2-like protein n=1 Tax=Dinothrombium tinctorium TaxID=1965070 RepID=A0A443QZR3_9ACAR|nr:coiled-coil-helix-coiled-coil-helix domain-containing protein 2-like protein [Dinothrombium tinctorium]